MEKKEMQKIQDSLNCPYVRCYRGCLGGVFITISLDEVWVNDILENSRYGKFTLDNGKIEHFSGFGMGKNFRKCKYKDVDDIISKLNKFILEVCL